MLCDYCIYNTKALLGLEKDTAICKLGVKPKYSVPMRRHICIFYKNINELKTIKYYQN